MADPDEAASRYGTGSGILDPILAFSPNLTLEEIKRRRAIAGALASRRRDFPKTVGEGMTYFGEALADAFETVHLGKAEKSYNERFEKDAAPVAFPGPGGSAEAPPVVPPVATASVARPGSAPPGPLAVADPLTWEPTSGPASRAAMAQTLEKLGANRMSAEVSSGSGGAPVMARGGGDTVTDEGGPNPPTIVNDIRPVRMAGGPAPAPVQPPAAPGGALAPVIPAEEPFPAAPTRSEALTKKETDALTLMRKYPGEKRAEDYYKQAHELGKATRDAEYDRLKREHDAKVQLWTTRENARQTAITNAPKTMQDLQQGAAATTKAQADEATRLQWGNLPAPVQKDLFESRDNAKAAAGSIGAMNNAEAVLNAGTLVGPTAQARMLYHKARALAGNEESQKIVANTQTFQATLGPAVMAAVKAYGGPQVSNTDREYAAAMVGSDITLSEEAIRKILDIGKRSAAAAMAEHRAKAEEHAKDAPALRKFLEVADPLAAIPMTSAAKPAAAPAASGRNVGDTATGPGGARIRWNGTGWEAM